ncbi:hypothetical protein RQP46_003336 [Phenoliferia psychrophenolica]
MSQSPPVAAGVMPSATIASLAPETLAQILNFATFKWEYDGNLEVHHDGVCTMTLKGITLTCKLWHDVAKPLHFRTQRITFDPFQPCKDLVPFQLDPSLANHVRSLTLELEEGSFSNRMGIRFTGPEGEADTAESTPQVEDWHALTAWMVTLENLSHLRISLITQIAPDSYAAWPLDAFLNVTALYVSSAGDSLFNQALISRMPNLESLYLAGRGYGFPDTTPQHLIASSALPDSRCLEKIFLEKMTDMSSSAFRQLVETSGGTLKVLEVYRASGLEDDDLACALDVAPGIERLQWCNEKKDQMTNIVFPLAPSLLRALSESDVTDLDICPWPTADALNALPDTLVKLQLGSVEAYPGNRYGWAYRGEATLKRVLEDTLRAVLDARDAGRFPNLEKLYDIMGEFGKLDAVLLKERAEQMGLQVGW